jgi:hypothetical protein
LELWLLYSGILPWSLAHEPLGTILGVISVAIFLVAVNHYIPQVGDYIMAGCELTYKRDAPPGSTHLKDFYSFLFDLPYPS